VDIQADRKCSCYNYYVTTYSNMSVTTGCCNGGFNGLNIGDKDAKWIHVLHFQTIIDRMTFLMQYVG